MVDLNEFMSAEQLARKCGVTTQSVRWAIKKGILRASMIGTRFFIHKTDAVLYLEWKQTRHIGRPRKEVQGNG
jgi:hypothetical protein